MKKIVESLGVAVGLFHVMSGAAIAAAPTARGALEIVGPAQALKLTLNDLQAKLKSVSVTVDDPVYKKSVTFDGFVLEDVLKLAGVDLAGTADEIVFTALDGYSPNTTFAALKSHKAVLTYRVHGSNGFGKVAQGKAMVDPGPYYVVWEEGGAKMGESVPWPYQLAKIEVVDFKQKFSKLFPNGAKADSGVMKGFVKFKNECVRCHSINLQGGDLGPELNIPQNVTEYWAKGTLKKFIRNSASFRAKDKMPPFPQLKDDELDQIVEYIEYMKGYKIPVPAT